MIINQTSWNTFTGCFSTKKLHPPAFNYFIFFNELMCAQLISVYVLRFSKEVAGMSREAKQQRAAVSEFGLIV